MELKSTLMVFNESELGAGPGVVPGHTTKRLAGTEENPSERIGVILASFEPGTVEHLHWHLIEAFHYVISGRAIVRDLEGNTYDVGPGSVIYAPPGIAGSHEWDVKEELRLLFIRAALDPEKSLSFRVDPSTKESRIPVERLGMAVNFKKSLY